MRDKGTVDVDPDRRDGLRLSSPSTPGGFDDDDARAADAARRDRTRRVRSTPAPPSGLPGAAVIEHPPDAVVISRRVRVCHKFCGTVRGRRRTFPARAHEIGSGGTQEVMRAGTMPDSPRLSILGVVPVVVLLLLAAVTGGVGADEGDEVASSSWWHGPDPPEGEPTDLEREMFQQRTPSCIVCQRAVHYLDENLLVKILDERAKDRSVNDPANYGRIEAIVEDEVSKVCSAQGIQLDKKLRNRCDDMLERFEDKLVRAWYDRSSQDDDWNMNWRICAKKHGLLKVCPVEIARLDVPQLDHLEQEVKLEELRSPVTEDKDGRRRVRYQTQAGKAKLARAGSGEMHVLNGKDFHARVIAEHGADTDALVYFAFANAHPRTHRGVMRTLKRAALAFRDENVKGKHHVALSVIDAERNEIPHPYGSHVKGPTLILYPAGDKHAPRMLPMRGGTAGRDDEEAAPTLGDVLALLNKRGGNQYTRDAAGKAFVEAEQHELEGSGRFSRDHDEL